MKVLHTSDWHLGRSLYDKKRYTEFEAFLQWLIQLIADDKIDVLLVAGDIFDTTTPSNRAQELYYHFLGQIAKTACRHVVIIGGNHDSPTFLDAPKNILSALNIKVVGAKTEFTEDEVMLLKNPDGEMEAIICAVPFLRDRDVRIAEEGEQPDDKALNLQKGIATHYREILQIARNLQGEAKHIPIIGMGHLFTSNATTTEGDGIRDLYIGTIAHIDGDSIAEGYDYMALGHLHLAQKVSNSDIIRYSGSPLAMTFSEADQDKKLIVADFSDQTLLLKEHTIPCFQKLVKITGNLDSVSERIYELKTSESTAWLEIEITDQIPATLLASRIDKLLAGTKMEILCIKNKVLADRALTRIKETETLETLSDTDVFSRCLIANEVPEEERASLMETYSEALSSLHTIDPNAL
jgi:exonuclease SbcD